MLNKRVKTLLALALAGAMVLAEPSALWASGENTEETSDSEETTSEREDSEEEEKSELNLEDKDQQDEKTEKSDETDTDTEEEKEEPPGAEEEESKPEKSEKKGKSDKKSEEKGSREKRARAYSNGIKVSGGTDADYSFDQATGVLTVKTNKKLKLELGSGSSGNVSANNSISVNSSTGADLELDGLYLSTSANAALNIMAGTGAVQITLSGNNVLNGAKNSIQVNNNGNVTIDGTGVLSGAAISGTVKVKGGNIMANVEKAIDVSGNALKQNVIGSLSANALYAVTGTGLQNYQDGVRADRTGRAALYLPEGYTVQASGNVLNVSPPAQTQTPTPSPTVSASGTPTPSPSPTVTQPALTPDLASEGDNGLYWIDSGQTYRSGATLQFYATGDGYGPEEPQELDPKEGSTRYIPVDWDVSTTSTSVSGNNSAKGSWNKYSEETTGRTDNGNYVPGEYRYKGSFQLNTTGTTSVPFTLRVNYQRQTYDADRGWRNDGSTAYKSVNFYIRNTAALTPTSTVRPTSTTYVRSTVTTSALRNNVSSNARNASTGDETPIGTLILMMAVAAVSGAAVFRKKRIR